MLAAWMSYLVQSLQLPDKFDGMTIVITPSECLEIVSTPAEQMAADFFNRKEKRNGKNNG
ncbi:hypothetical protein D3C72_2518090 [compost metagenome]